MKPTPAEFCGLRHRRVVVYFATDTDTIWERVPALRGQRRGHIAVTATGHCHPEVVAAIKDQAGELLHMSGTDFYYRPQIDLAERLARVAPGPTPKKVFFTNSGAEAIEGALKLARWHTECPPRWKSRSERRLVISYGANDIAAGVTLARHRLNLANILDEAATTGVGSFVVGPTPTLDAEANGRLEVLADAQADVCARRSVPYVDCFHPLRDHDQWQSDLAAGDGVHPGQAGYGLIAWLVLHNGWADWLQIA